MMCANFYAPPPLIFAIYSYLWPSLATIQSTVLQGTQWKRRGDFLLTFCKRALLTTPGTNRFLLRIRRARPTTVAPRNWRPQRRPWVWMKWTPWRLGPGVWKYRHGGLRRGDCQTADGDKDQSKLCAGQFWLCQCLFPMLGVPTRRWPSSTMQSGSARMIPICGCSKYCAASP